MTRARVLRCVLCASLLAKSAPASTQEAQSVSPPVVQGSTDVPYPAQAHGDAYVVLELLVEADGSVVQIDVVEGREPFAGQARRAVLSWQFTPAHRDDAPVAARIRARVDFHQEQPRPAVAPAAASPAPSPALQETPLEVIVRGQRQDIGKTTISSADVRALPGAFGDPFRAIEALPGVTPIVSGIPYFYLRGAPPNDSGYYVDGVRVPLLFHVGLGQGVIHPALIDRVEVFAGAPPASYGGFAGAIIAGQIREPATTLRGAANVRLVDAGALLEAPLGAGSVLVAGRYGYPGPILGAIARDVALDYWDYQLRATWKLSEHDTLGVFAFGSHDYFATGAPLVEQFVSDFHRLDLRYDHAFPDGRLRFALTGGFDSRGAAPSYLSDRSLGARLELEQQLAAALRLQAGAAASVDAYGFREELGDWEHRVFPSTVDPPPTNLVAGVYADLVWRVAPAVEIVPGARVDVYQSARGGATTTVPAFDPRLAVRVRLAAAVASLSTVGLSHQFPALRVGSIPAWIVTPQGGTTRCVQSNVGPLTLPSVGVEAIF
jgi:TonB-dependent Receptor Plug Domain/Gram-negative bacterial TonB protein C-terminal